LATGTTDGNPHSITMLRSVQNVQNIWTGASAHVHFIDGQLASNSTPSPTSVPTTVPPTTTATPTPSPVPTTVTPTTTATPTPSPTLTTVPPTTTATPTPSPVPTTVAPTTATPTLSPTSTSTPETTTSTPSPEPSTTPTPTSPPVVVETSGSLSSSITGDSSLIPLPQAPNSVVLYATENASSSLQCSFNKVTLIPKTAIIQNASISFQVTYLPSAVDVSVILTDEYGDQAGNVTVTISSTGLANVDISELYAGILAESERLYNQNSSWINIAGVIGCDYQGCFS
jgi:hypothetical protein